MILSIPTPVGETFLVVIKNSIGATVYTDAHGNEDFDPAITTPGDYEMYIDGGDTPVWCFTISECECPEILSVSVSEVDGTFYGTFVFDFPEGFGCPFKIYVESAFASGTFVINNIGDLTLQTGTIYYRQFIIGGVGELTWNVKLLDDTLCDSGFIGEEECIGVTLVDLGEAPLDFLFATNFLLGAWSVIYEANCTDVECEITTINYLQVNAGIVGAPDSGTLLAYNLCDNPTFPVTPNISYPGYTTGVGAGRPKYSVTITTCCGAVYSDITRQSLFPEP